MFALGEDGRVLVKPRARVRLLASARLRSAWPRLLASPSSQGCSRPSQADRLFSGQLRRILQLLDDVSVRTQCQLGSVAKLAGHVDHVPPLMEEKGGERVPKVVRPSTLDTCLDERLEETPLPPFLEAVSRPFEAVVIREHECVVAGAAARSAPLGQVRREWSKKPDGAAADRLSRVDEQRSLAHIPPPESADLSRAQAGVGEDRDDGGVAQISRPADRLDGERRQLSTAIGFSPSTAIGSPHRRPCFLPAGGHRFSPLRGCAAVVAEPSP
jgi:hypothetical protein